MDHVRLRVGLVTGAYIAGFSVWAMVRANHEFLFYALVLAALIAFIVYVDRCVRFSAGVLWGLSAGGLLHMAGGNIPVSLPDHEAGAVLYYVWLIPGALRYDQLVHAFTCAVAAFGVWEMLAAIAGRRLTMSAVGAVVVACTAMGLGSINELVEFATTRAIPDTNVGGYENNAWDLVFNSLGASIATVVIWIRDRPRASGACAAPPAEAARADPPPR